MKRKILILALFGLFFGKEMYGQGYGIACFIFDETVSCPGTHVCLTMDMSGCNPTYGCSVYGAECCQDAIPGYEPQICFTAANGCGTDMYFPPNASIGDLCIDCAQYEVSIHSGCSAAYDNYLIHWVTTGDLGAWGITWVSGDTYGGSPVFPLYFNGANGNQFVIDINNPGGVSDQGNYIGL